jgi:hypothetical protein
LNTRRRDQHEAAGFIIVDGVRRVHGREHVGCLHPDRRVFVARNVKDEEAVGLCVVSGERRDMAAGLLAQRFAQVVDEHEMFGLAKIGAGQFAEVVNRAVRRVMDFRLDWLVARIPPSWSSVMP